MAYELKNASTLLGTAAEIMETTEIEVAGSPAIEVIAKTGPVFMTSQFFITDGRRLYSLIVGSERDPREDHRLIDSFSHSNLMSRMWTAAKKKSQLCKPSTFQVFPGARVFIP